MRLFDKIDQYYKVAQNAVSPHQMMADAIHKVMDQISQHPKISGEEKESLKNELHKHFNCEPDSRLDAEWFNHMAAAMDIVIGEFDGAKEPDVKNFHHKMCEMLSAAWDQIESLGHKAHANKPVIM